jgi:hypothetical protein
LQSLFRLCLKNRIPINGNRNINQILSQPDRAIRKPRLQQDATVLDVAASSGMPALHRTAPQGGKVPKQESRKIKLKMK